MFIHRRRFLHLAIGAGSSLGLGAVAWRSATSTRHGEACDHAAIAEAGLQMVSHTSRALGSDTSITAFHSDRDTVQQAIKAAFAELELVEELMSIYRPESQLSRLNRHGKLDLPHPYLVEVLRAAQGMSARSGGGFDVTVQPLWESYAAAQRARRLPRAAEIEAARSKVDWRKLEVTARRIRLRGAGMMVTLNGIAQGFAADRAADALGRFGIRHALVNAGEIGSVGGRPTGEAWTVGIQHPRRGDAFISLAALQGRSLSTSGDYATAFSDDFRHHHIVDPHTGRSPPALASVSVVAATATQADALSTALFVLGLKAGLKLVRSTPAVEALFILKDSRMLATPGFPIKVERS